MIILNTYASNITGTKYIKEVWIDPNGELDSNTVRVEEFKTFSSAMDRLSRQKISKEILNFTLD
jgi:hypothetical protein